MLKKLTAKLPTIPVWAWYVIIVILAIVLYLPTRDSMIVQDAWIRVVKSKLTVNYITLLFLWGWLADRGRLSKNKRRNTIFWIGGLVLIIGLQMLSPF